MSILSKLKSELSEEVQELNKVDECFFTLYTRGDLSQDGFTRSGLFGVLTLSSVTAPCLLFKETKPCYYNVFNG